MIKGILFDNDGVLTEMCWNHYQALNNALNDVCGFIIERDEHLAIFNGLPTKKKLNLLIEQGRITKTDIQIISELKQKYTKKLIMELKSDPIKIELHEEIKNLKIKAACVTNSITETTELMLNQTGQLKYMDFIVSNEMVKNPKPHGEGYIRGMIKMGLMPNEILIVEDSPVGIQAAKTTGANIWRVKDSHDVTKENFIKIKEALKGLEW